MGLSWNFHQAHQQNVDLSPIMEGEKVAAGVTSQVARNLMESAQRSQGLAEQKREFDIEATQKAALAAATQKHYEAEQTHFQAIEDLNKARAAHEAAMDEYRTQAPQRTQARTDALAGAYGVPVAAQVGPNQPGAINTQGLSPADLNAVMQHFGQQKMRDAQLQKSQQAVAEHASQVQDATDTFNKALAGGTLNPAEHAAFTGMAQKDPKGALGKFIDYSAKKADTEHEEQYRGDVTSRAIKTANEREKLGDFDAGKELRAAAASLAHYHGKDLQDKLLALDEKSQGFSLPAATRGAAKPNAPKVTTTSGARVEVSPALAKGGTFDELRDNPKAMNELTTLARSEAQKDPEYVAAVKEAAALRSMGGKADKGQLQAAENKLDQIVAKHGNALAGQLGWKAPESAAGGKSPVQTLRDEVTSGKLKDHAALEARAKELGVTLK